VLIPAGDGGTRLIQRSRSNEVGVIWDVLYPGILIMQRGMLFGIKKRVERSVLP
jgi:ABC-type polysaccharide/polyol phosphate export permease